MKSVAPVSVQHKRWLTVRFQSLCKRWRHLARFTLPAMQLRAVASPAGDIRTDGYATVASQSLPLSTQERSVTPSILVAVTTSVPTDTLQLELAQAGFSVVITHTGQEAFAIVQEHHPHLLVLDRQLPLISGLELCRIIRKDSQVPIIIVAGHAPVDEQIEALNSGADAYVVQPFTERELSARIRAILRRTSS